MSKLKAYVRLLRPHQYYKNLLVFLGLVFAAQVFEVDNYPPLLLAFVGLCAVSSASYVLNDWRDIGLDRAHPEKKNRPLAAGTVSIPEAMVLVVILLVVAGLTVVLVPISDGNLVLYLLLLVAVFTTSQTYSLYFKNQPFYDVTFIALNYIWRAVTGVVVINVTLSPWLFILGFLFALFLALSKRKGDLALLGEDAAKHKPVFRVYTNGLLDQLVILISGAMIVAYSIYVVEAVVDHSRGLQDYAKFQNPSLMLLTLPVVTLVIMRLIFLQFSGTASSRKAELLFLDKQIVALGVIVGLLTFAALFWDELSLQSLVDLFYQGLRLW